MKEKFFLALSIFFILSHFLNAKPNFYGSDGLLRIYEAKNRGGGHFHFVVTFLGSRGSHRHEDAPRARAHLRTGLYNMGDARVGLGYTATDFLTLHLNIPYHVDFFVPEARDIDSDFFSAYGIGDLNLGAKLIYPPIEDKVFYGGVLTSINLPTGVKRAPEREPLPRVTKGGVFRYFSASVPRVGIMGIATLDLTPISRAQTAPQFHFNVGCSLSSDEDYALGNTLQIGIGSEFPTPGVTPFIEFHFTRWIEDTGGELGPAPIWLTVGFHTPGGQCAFDWRVSSPNKVWPAENINTGWGGMPQWRLTLSFYSQTEKATGSVIVKVVDADTGLPLAADISFPEIREIPRTSTDAGTGMVTINKVPMGVQKIKCEKFGYYTQVTAVEVKKRKQQIVTFKLKEVGAVLGKLTGRVTDSESGEPLVAEILCPGLDVEKVKSDETTGEYSIEEIPIGVVTVEARAKGYHPKSTTVVIRKGETSVCDFELELILGETGSITGKVVDAKTEEAILATISLPGTKVKSVVSNPETGIFVIKKAPVGIVTLEVSAEGYTDKKEVVVVKKDETIIKNITLSPKKKGTGIISGKVIAKESGSPLGAEIIFPDLGLKTTSDLVRGIYKLEVPIGTHTVCVKSEGYIEQSLPVVIKSDETTLQNFELVKKGASIILPGINFESGKARILPSSRPALEKAAQILRQHPRLRVEIQGHTDSVGSESYNLRLSRARANAVRQYLIQHFKIDPKRLIAKGYGESQPIAENTTREGRAKNRRIEFVLLE